MLWYRLKSTTPDVSAVVPPFDVKLPINSFIDFKFDALNPAPVQLLVGLVNSLSVKNLNSYPAIFSEG